MQLGIGAERCCNQQRTALGTPAPDFSSGFTPEVSPRIGYRHEVAEVCNQGFPSPRWAINQGWRAPFSQRLAFRPFSLSVKTVPHREGRELDLAVGSFVRTP